MSSLMLVGAVFASLALGVLVASVLCHLIFLIFRVHVLSASRRRQAANLNVIAEN